MSWRGIKRSKSDEMMSRYVRYRDSWQCQCCGKTFEELARNLHASHYVERGNFALRYDPENVDALCASCHEWIETFDGKSWYDQFKKEQLGEEGYKKLLIRKDQRGSKDEKLAQLFVKGLIDDLEQNTNVKVLLP